MSDEEDFKWSANDSIVLQDQPALAVYQNPVGQVVLRREAHWDETEDCFIYICRGNVLAVIAAMIRTAELHDVLLAQRSGGGYADYPVWPEEEASEPLQIEGPKDRTAAERQRRHRANKARRDHDSVRDAAQGGVTERDARLLEFVG